MCVIYCELTFYSLFHYILNFCGKDEAEFHKYFSSQKAKTFSIFKKLFGSHVIKKISVA